MKRTLILAALAAACLAGAAPAFFESPAPTTENPLARPGCILQLRWRPENAAQVSATYAPIFGSPVAACTRTEARAMANALAASLEDGPD